MKDNLPENAAIVLLDFAESYPYIVQDATQSFHWNNVQATLHPIVVYHLQNEMLVPIDFCVISDTNAVHCFLKNTISKLRGIIPGLSHLIYLVMVLQVNVTTSKISPIYFITKTITILVQNVTVLPKAMVKSL